MKPNILVTIKLNSTEQNKMTLKCKNANLLFKPVKELGWEEYDCIDAIVGYVKQEDINKFKHLKWVQVEIVGVDRILSYLPNDVLLTNAAGAYGYAIAEQMVASVYTLYKKIDIYCNNQYHHRWEKMGKVKDICNSNVLVLGMGDIGTNFAMRMNLLGAKVTGIRRNVENVPDYLQELVTMDDLDYQLTKADIVACALPSNKETRHLFNYERLKKIKSEAILLNVGRGDLIVSADLIRIVNEGKLGGVWLDVVEEEPLSSDSALWNLPRTIITPHIAGSYNLPGTKEKVLDICMENINHWTNSERMINQINK